VDFDAWFIDLGLCVLCAYVFFKTQWNNATDKSVFIYPCADALGYNKVNPTDFNGVLFDIKDSRALLHTRLSFFIYPCANAHGYIFFIYPCANAHGYNKVNPTDFNGIFIQKA
jgi:hypothetical protein